MKPVSCSSLFKGVLACSIVAMSGASAFALPGAAKLAIRASADKRVKAQDCSVLPPIERDKAQPRYGLTRDELVALANVNADDEKWVRWYIGGDSQFDALMKSPATPITMDPPRIAGWAGCEDMKHFIQIANVDLFMTPKMVCTAGPYNYILSLAGNRISLEMGQFIQTVAPPAPRPLVAQPGRAGPPPVRIGSTARPSSALRTLFREPVDVAQTQDSGCDLQVTAQTPDDRNLKICLSAQPTGASTDGVVTMKLAGRDLPANLQSLACHANFDFVARARRILPVGVVVPTEVGSTQPAAQSSHRFTR